MKLELIAKHEKDSRACRDAFALTLKDMMAADKSVCYVDCDLMGCVNTKQLMAAYPDRAYEAGIAEANAAGYGPYQRGRDPEYAWYQDRDRDGLVCER